MNRFQFVRSSSRKRGPIGVPRDAMAVGGQIITVDDGSRAKRVPIGFGVGKSRMTSAAQLHALTKTAQISSGITRTRRPVDPSRGFSRRFRSAPQSGDSPCCCSS